MRRERFSETLKDAVRAKDPRRMSTLRLIQAAIKDRDIAARGKGNKDGVSEDELLGLLQSMIKQRRDSITLYEKGGRMGRLFKMVTLFIGPVLRGRSRLRLSRPGRWNMTRRPGRLACRP